MFHGFHAVSDKPHLSSLPSCQSAARLPGNCYGGRTDLDATGDHEDAKMRGQDDGGTDEWSRAESLS